MALELLFVAFHSGNANLILFSYVRSLHNFYCNFWNLDPVILQGTARHIMYNNRRPKDIVHVPFFWKI